MNSNFRQVVAICVLTIFTIAVSGAVPEQPVIPTALPDNVAAELVGGSWSQFLSGVGCGLGLVAMASGYASGMGALPAAIATVSILRMCDSAFS